MQTIGTATATATEPSSRPTQQRIPVSFHVVAMAWLAGMLVFARVAPAAYEAAMQEDRFIEWWTAMLFASAGVLRLIAAIRTRHVFDGLVALFCLFVAGEEFSWGQRLLGFTPPDYFLAHNTQQEFSLHNFADVFGKPKSVLMLALAGFGIVLPLIGWTARGRSLLEAVGASVPARALVPWFAAAIALLLWYPMDFTGEWVETFAGALFLVSTPAFGRALALTPVLALVLTVVSNVTAKPNASVLACTRAEVEALLQDVRASLAFDDELLHRNVHKRFQSAIEDHYLAPELTHFNAVTCAGEAADAAARRRRYAIDPWGLAYWIKSERFETGSTITVYSFGSNRRRDGDDVQGIRKATTN